MGSMPTLGHSSVSSWLKMSLIMQLGRMVGIAPKLGTAEGMAHSEWLSACRGMQCEASLTGVHPYLRQRAFVQVETILGQGGGEKPGRCTLFAGTIMRHSSAVIYGQYIQMSMITCRYEHRYRK